MVFTPKEILGLGYEIILLYHLGQQEVVCEISKKLPQEPLRDFHHGARLELPENYLSCLNEWIISASRAHHVLLVVEPNAKKTHAIRHFIHHLLGRDVCLSYEMPLDSLAHDTNWSEEILRLLSLNLEEQALAAYEKFIRPQTHLSMTSWLAQQTSKAPSASNDVEPLDASIETLCKNTQDISPKPIEISSQILSPQQVITKEDFKHALENISPFIENESLYNQHLKKYFLMEWAEWTPFIMQAGQIDATLLMLNKYDAIQSTLIVEEMGPFFSEDEDYTRSGSKNSDQNFKKLRYNSRQENWRRDERSTQKIHAS